MASYTVSRSKNATLTATVVDDVTLSANKPWVQVWNLSNTDSIWFTAGTSVDPTVAGDDTICVPVNGIVSVKWPGAGVAVVRLISDGTPEYSVVAMDAPSNAGAARQGPAGEVTDAELAAAVALRVAKAGDTMTGALVVGASAVTTEMLRVGGRVSVGSASDLSAALGVIIPAAGTLGITVKMAASQTAVPFRIRTSADVDVMTVSAVGAVKATNELFIDGAAGLNRGLYLRTDSTARWFVTANSTAESGSNAGSDLSIYRYTDAGAFAAAALSISRASGLITTTGDLALARTGATTTLYLNGQTSQSAQLLIRSDVDAVVKFARQDATVDWQVYRAGASTSPLYVRDMINARTQITYSGGANADGALTYLDSRTMVGTATDLGATLGVQATSASRKGVLVKLAAAGTGNGFEQQNSAGTTNFAVDPTGIVRCSDVYASGYWGPGSYVGGGVQISSSGVLVRTDTAANVTLTVGNQTTATAALTEWLSAGVLKRAVLASGRDSYIAANTATTVGAAGAAAALPVLPLGYLLADIAGVSVKIPYYTA